MLTVETAEGISSAVADGMPALVPSLQSPVGVVPIVVDVADTVRGSSSSAAVPILVDVYRGKKREADPMDVMIVAMDDARLIHEKIDYSLLQSMEELSALNATGYDNAEVAIAKCEGLEMLDTFDVYDVVQNKDRGPEGKHVDTKWEAAMRAGKLKLRIVGRELDFWRKGTTASPLDRPMQHLSR
jgi:hypothetical protein